MKHIYFTVTNDLSFDQRMHRICASLAAHGYLVTLVGRRKSGSRPLEDKPFRQRRLYCIFEKGFLFYAEYNLRLFLFLLFKKMDAVCAIDLDTILPCLAVSALKSVPRVYDAHEYFTELKEVKSRPVVKSFWLGIERACVPRFTLGYTVSPGLAAEFRKRYGRDYAVIRNIPPLRPLPAVPRAEPFLLYQGAVNEGRAFEYLIPAMQHVPYPLLVCGDGNFMGQLKKLVRDYKVSHKVILKGMLAPEDLWAIAPGATLGIGLAEKEGLNQYLALPNKFFDYLHAGVPQLSMNYPEYAALNRQFNVAVLLDGLAVEEIAQTINALMADTALLGELRQNCLSARAVLNWQQEEQGLVRYYNRIFHER